MARCISDINAIPPHTGWAEAAALGLGGPYSGCCEGPGRLPHGKPGLGASQPGPTGRPWAAGHVFTELIGLIECHAHGAKRVKSERLQFKRICNKPQCIPSRPRCLVNFQFFLSAPNSDRKSGNVDIKKDSGDEFGAYSIFLN